MIISGKYNYWHYHISLVIWVVLSQGKLLNLFTCSVKLFEEQLMLQRQNLKQLIQSFLAEIIIIIIANFLVLTANICLIKTYPDVSRLLAKSSSGVSLVEQKIHLLFLKLKPTLKETSTPPPGIGWAKHFLLFFKMFPILLSYFYSIFFFTLVTRKLLNLSRYSFAPGADSWVTPPFSSIFQVVWGN